MVKVSALQLGGRRLEIRRVRTDMAGWLDTSLLNNSTDCLPAGHLALGTGICGNDLCKLRCLISRIPAGPFNRGWQYNKANLSKFSNSQVQALLLLLRITLHCKKIMRYKVTFPFAILCMNALFIRFNCLLNVEYWNICPANSTHYMAFID